jgi:hypothetical protein
VVEVKIRLDEGNGDVREALPSIAKGDDRRRRSVYLPFPLFMRCVILVHFCFSVSWSELICGDQISICSLLSFEMVKV